MATLTRQQRSGVAEARDRRRLIRCHSAPCDDFYPEPDPPQIDPLKKSPGSAQGLIERTKMPSR